MKAFFIYTNLYRAFCVYLLVFAYLLFLFPAQSAAQNTDDLEVIWEAVLKTRGGCEIYEHATAGLTKCGISRKFYKGSKDIRQLSKSDARRYALGRYRDAIPALNGQLKTMDQRYISLLAILELGTEDAIRNINLCKGETNCVYLQIANAYQRKWGPNESAKDCISCRIQRIPKYIDFFQRYDCIPQDPFYCDLPNTMIGRENWDFTK